ncbi:MAG: DUF2510 domain-containing protein [Mycobacterium sp.]
MTDPYRRFSIRLYKHTGAVILWNQQRYVVTGTLEQCESAYRGAQNHNLLAGWWSLVSVLVMNWIALISNLNAIRQVRRLAQQPAVPVGPPPGWYSDPSGPGQRYWDGAGWTQWTHPPTPGLVPQGR